MNVVIVEEPIRFHLYGIGGVVDETSVVAVGFSSGLVDGPPFSAIGVTRMIATRIAVGSVSSGDGVNTLVGLGSASRVIVG